MPYTSLRANLVAALETLRLLLGKLDDAELITSIKPIGLETLDSLPTQLNLDLLSDELRELLAARLRLAGLDPALLGLPSLTLDELRLRESLLADALLLDKRLLADNTLETSDDSWLTQIA